MFELNGKVCLVTGGSRGLGESMAVTFAKAGAEAVIITYNSDENKAIEVCKSIETHGSAVIDMSSISPLVSQKIYKECLANGVDFLDAPVSGGEPMAISGDLAIMVGGEEKVFNKFSAIFDILGKSKVYCGSSGAGNTTKLANQIIVAANIEALGEALVLSKKSGLDPKVVLNAIQGGLAGSNVLNAKGPMMAEGNFDPGFSKKSCTSL